MPYPRLEQMEVVAMGPAARWEPEVAMHDLEEEVSFGSLAAALKAGSTDRAGVEAL